MLNIVLPISAVVLCAATLWVSYLRVRRTGWRKEWLSLLVIAVAIYIGLLYFSLAIGIIAGPSLPPELARPAFIFLLSLLLMIEARRK